MIFISSQKGIILIPQDKFPIDILTVIYDYAINCIRQVCKKTDRSLIELKEILSCFKPSEKFFIKDLLKLKTRTCESKKYKLLELLENKKHLNDSQAANIIYKKPSGSAFSHLKERLKNDLLDLLLQKGTKGLSDQHIIWEVKARKLYTKGLLLYYHGLREISLNLLYKSLKICNKHELFDLKLSLLEFIGTHFQDERVKRSIWKQYKKAFGQHWELKTIKFAYFSESNSALAHNGLHNTESIGSTSKNLEYWYHKSAVKYHTAQKNFRQAYNHSINTISLIESKPELFTKEEFSKENLKAAQLCIYEEKFGCAQKFSKEVLKLASHELLKRRALEIMFYSFFYQQNWKESNKVIKNMLADFKTENPERDKWMYYKANLKFCTGACKESVKILNQLKLLSRISINAQLGQRLLEILSLIELQDYDWLEYKLDSFRKAIRKTRRKSHTRIHKINQILHQLVLSNYDFIKSYHDQKSAFTQLRNRNGSCARDPMGYEIVDFYCWFKDKAAIPVK